MAKHRARDLAVAILLMPIAAAARPVDGPDEDALFEDLLAPQPTSSEASADPVAPEPSTEPSPAARRPRTSRVVEEIVVTAQKREEMLDDVPISVAAFSGDKLEAMGVDGPIDLPQITPGMQYDSLVGYSVVYLRGVGTEIFLPNSDPSVATYIDGIYLPFSHGAATDFGKLERIEILKGPQGTLFGRNATGGAINVVSAKPNQERLEGSLSYEVGDLDTRNFKGYVSGPLTDTLSASLSVIANQADNQYRRPDDSRFPDFPQERLLGVSAKLNWEISETLGLTLNGMTTRQNGLNSVVTTSFDVKPAGLLLGVRESPEPYVTDPDDDIHFRGASDVGFGELRWSPGLFNVKLLGSFQDISTDVSFDFEGSSADLINFHPKDQGAAITTAELQFLSEEGGWMTELFGRRLQWIAGVYYFRSDDAGFRDLEVPVGDGLLAFPGLDALIDQIGELLGIPLPSGADLQLTALVDTVAYAAFAQFTYDLSDRLALTLGARWQDEERELHTATTNLLNSDGTTTRLLTFPDRQRQTTQLSPKATLDFKFGDDGLAFLSWQRGLKSGTFNIVNIYTVAGEVEPEELTNYELGIKGSLGGGSFRYGAGLFQNDIDDLQVLFISVQSGGAVTIENAGKARIQGFDMDLQWQPLPQSLPGLVVTASGALLDGEYLEYENGSGFDENTGVFFGGTGLVVGGGVLPGRDFSGNQTVRTPKYSYNVGLSYTFDAPGGVVELGGSTYYNDGYFFSAQNKDSVSQPSYTIYNARASYLHERSGVRLTIFGKNLGDELYWYNQFETDFNTIGTLAPQRYVGARIDWRF
jgi:iron complex outermembrane recepter protein